MRMLIASIMLSILLYPVIYANGQVKGWPKGVVKIQYQSKADSTKQPALFYSPGGDKKVPLLVALHTWSGSYIQGGGQTTFAKWCIDQGWLFIHPNFRGPNWTPEGMGSEPAVGDILSAVEHVKAGFKVDTDRIYLVGVSGGGHASLLMAGRAPKVWAGVSAWCGISDIHQWWKEKKGGKYAKHIEKACGGNPDTDPAVADQCKKRSPLTYLQNAGMVNLDINAGVKDGRKGSVPFTHSLFAFNRVAKEADRIPAKDIELFYKDMVVPTHMKKPLSDPIYGKRKPLFRKTSQNCRVTIFDGGHEIVHAAALNWLAKQRRGKDAVWVTKDSADLKTTDKDAASGL